MASNFPTSLDSFANPTSSSNLDSPSHSGQHSDINDAVEAIEVKLGIGSSPAGSATAGWVLTAGTGGATTWSAIDSLPDQTGNADKYLFTNGTAASWETVVIPSTTIDFNQQTGTTYTLILSDQDKMIELNNASPITLTVPLNSSEAFPVGSEVNLLQTGAGQVTIAGAGGVTVNATPGLKLRTQWSSATLIKRATDTWVAIGDLSA